MTGYVRHVVISGVPVVLPLRKETLIAMQWKRLNIVMYMNTAYVWEGLDYYFFKWYELSAHPASQKT